MNKKQWYVLSWSFMILGILFIWLDTMNGVCLSALFSSVSELSFADIHCVVNSEMYEPFIYISYFFWIVFMILGWMEKK